MFSPPPNATVSEREREEVEEELLPCAEEIAKMRGVHLRNYVKKLALKNNWGLCQLNSFRSVQTPLLITKRNHRSLNKSSARKVGRGLLPSATAAAATDDDEDYFNNDYFNFTNASTCSPCVDPNYYDSNSNSKYNIDDNRTQRSTSRLSMMSNTKIIADNSNLYGSFDLNGEERRRKSENYAKKSSFLIDSSPQMLENSSPKQKTLGGRRDHLMMMSPPAMSPSVNAHIRSSPNSPGAVPYSSPKLEDTGLDRLLNGFQAGRSKDCDGLQFSDIDENDELHDSYSEEEFGEEQYESGDDVSEGDDSFIVGDDSDFDEGDVDNDDDDDDDGNDNESDYSGNESEVGSKTDDDDSHFGVPKKETKSTSTTTTKNNNKDKNKDKNKDEEKQLSYRAFSMNREKITREVYREFNAKAFGSRLPDDLQITWCNRLLTTAGTTLSSKKNGLYSARMKLSIKVCDSEERLRSTLLHEMCHVAATLLSHCMKPPHGEVFQNWARTCEKKLGHMVVTTCHSYKINYPHRWQCVNSQCNQTYGRHTKNSIDVNKHACSKCGCGLQYFGAFDKNGTPKKAREASGFSLFVKDNYKNVKRGLGSKSKVKHADVMAKLSAKYKESKGKENCPSSPSMEVPEGKQQVVVVNIDQEDEEELTNPRHVAYPIPNPNRNTTKRPIFIELL